MALLRQLKNHQQQERFMRSRPAFGPVDVQLGHFGQPLLCCWHANLVEKNLRTIWWAKISIPSWIPRGNGIIGDGVSLEREIGTDFGPVHVLTGWLGFSFSGLWN